MRIVKEKASHKIDAIIALAMAVCGASEGEKGMPGLFFAGGVRAGRKEEREKFLRGD